MRKHKKPPSLNAKRKDSRKVVKVVVQAVILAAVLLLLIEKVFVVQYYKEPERAAWSQQRGFVALSYFGVSRAANSKSVSQDQLDRQLKTLHDQGYVTISQQDIIDYYASAKPLPEKALFLSFEDGRNDSVLFAQPILQKYNYKATFLSYADKMGDDQGKFVQPKQMLKMLKSGFWELGSNGYRLSYINVFDNDGYYLGAMDEKELPDKTEVAYYNHYLMDFIRDENRVLLEDRKGMEARISKDYELMRSTYEKELGFMPRVYMIMHANSLGFGMNNLVSDVNLNRIKENFSIHFNREGIAFNTGKNDIYDLNRVQPGASWSTNHLLMQIRNDSHEKVDFVTGNAAQSGQWNLSSGGAEFLDDKLILTSRTQRNGMTLLAKPAEASGFSFSASLLGNVMGTQSVYAGYDPQTQAYLKISLRDNVLVVEQREKDGEAAALAEVPLSDVKWGDQDLQLNRASIYTQTQTQQSRQQEPAYPYNLPGDRKLDFKLTDDKLQVSVDGEVRVDGLQVSKAVLNGQIALEAYPDLTNKQDTIYDAVFRDLQIQSGTDTEPTILFTNKADGMERVSRTIVRGFDGAVDWAIQSF